MNGILSEKSKSLAFTGHRTIPIERQDEIRARLAEAVSLACRLGLQIGYNLLLFRHGYGIRPDGC